MHAWFSFHLSVPSAWDWNVEFILIRSLRKVLPYFKKPFQVSTESNQMQTCTPQTTFDEELHPISTLVVSMS
jgi:hypothetical protein